MSKKSNAKRVLNALRSFGVSFEVLSEGDDYPVHIRTHNMDIWPSTGTFRLGNKTTRRNLNRLLELICKSGSFDSTQESRKSAVGVVNSDSSSFTDVLGSLNAQLSELVKKVEFMNDRITDLETKLSYRALDNQLIADSEKYQ